MGEVVIKKGFLPYSDGSGDSVTITIGNRRDDTDVLEIHQFDSAVQINLGDWAKLRDGIDAAVDAWAILNGAA